MSTQLSQSALRPSSVAGSARAYTPPSRAVHIDLRLDSNERKPDPRALTQLLAAISPDDMARYPSASALESLIADRLGVDRSQVLVTAGADEAIERACRAYLELGREVLITSPTFEMIAKSARLAQATVRQTPWESGPFPTQALIAQVSPATGMIAVVTPNNPTGLVASADDLRALSSAAPQALLLIDLAYTEFAEEDLTDLALGLPNALIVRTFSKAWGLAGLRVGFAAGPAEVIERLRAVGGPYTVSAPSVAATQLRLSGDTTDVAQYCDRIRDEREIISTLLSDLGASALPSQANFVLGQFSDAGWVADGLGSLGIAVRRFASSSNLSDRLRITCPGSDADLNRLLDGLRTILAPQALLFDMDGVIADVSRSYRAAIIGVARTYGVELTPADVARAKDAGDANNDWALTRRLLLDRGIDAPLQDVTERFEAIYQGDASTSGLRESETLLVSRELLEALAARLPLGIVTGRPRMDCERFLSRFGIAELFQCCVCMEDGPAKPDPTPVRLALEALGVRRAWLLGDTPDDIVASRRAGVLPLGILAPGPSGVMESDARRQQAVLTDAGAARVLANAQELTELLEASRCLSL